MTDDRGEKRQAVSSILAFEIGEARLALFWSKVEKSDGCWMWRGNISTGGYGAFRVGRGYRKAHRIAWYLANGPIPEWADICHHCDNPGCVNPAHLFAGTTRDNIVDMERKGRARHPRGESGGRAKLTESDVKRIRGAEFHRHGDKARLAREFGISRAVVWSIRQRRIWRHVQ